MKNFIKNLDTPNEYFYFSDKKNLIGDLACFMINSSCLFFDDFKPYIKLRTHYQYIPDTEILISIIKHFIHPDKRYSIKTLDIKEVISRIQDCPDIQIDFESYYENNKYFINLANGVYDIRNHTLLEHDIGYHFDYCLSFSYIKKKLRILDTYNYFIQSSIGEENEESFRIALGYSLSSLYDVKKAILIIGPGNSAKSKILDIIEKGIGTEYVRTNAFDKIGSEKAVASYAGGIRVNLSRDVCIGKIKEDAGFKSVISCEPINGRLLYKNEISVTPRVHCIAASNSFPQFRNADDASLDRLAVIRISGYTGKPDPSFPSRLFKELDSICSEAVDTLDEFIKSNYNFKLSRQSKELLKHEKAKLHTAESFIAEQFTFDSTGYISSKELYESYCNWCEQNAFDPIGKNTFYDTVKLINAGIFYKKVPYGKGYVNGFWGIKNKCTNSSTCDNDCNKISNGTNTNQPIQSDIANAG